MEKYGKLFWAIAGAVAFFLQAALIDGMMRSEWVGVAIAAVGAAVTWMAQDTTMATWVKSSAGGILSALLAAQLIIDNGINAHDWVGIVIALLTGAGVVIDPRRPIHQEVVPTARAAA